MPNKPKTYHDEITIQNTIKLRDMLKELPVCVSDFFRSIEFTKESRTKLAYATDLRTFFEYVINSCPQIKCGEIRQITISDLEQITAADIEEFLAYMKYYEKDGKIHTNGEASIKRKLCSIRCLYNYLHKHKIINVNPAIQVDLPKLHDKAIVRFDPNEACEFLDNVESGNKLTKNQLISHEKLKGRDLALLTLLLGTGIRVSECVGLDLNDVDFRKDCIKVIRKGGYEDTVYFGDEVKEALLSYMEERKAQTPQAGHENALFLSYQNKRLSVRSVEKLVKKYSKTVTSVKKITPHKLRSTYGTNLYNATNDIYLVASVLGHKDVNTTRKHYADIYDETKKDARNAVKLRDEQN
jgi:integrase/recombinase XerC